MSPCGPSLPTPSVRFWRAAGDTANLVGLNGFAVGGIVAGLRLGYLLGCRDRAVRRIAAHYMRSPDVLSEEEVRAYLLHLRDERGVARGTFKTNHGGIRFLYLTTLDRDWALFSQKNGFARRGSSGCRSCSLMPRSTLYWLRCVIQSTGPAFN